MRDSLEHAREVGGRPVALAVDADLDAQLEIGSEIHLARHAARAGREHRQEREQFVVS